MNILPTSTLSKKKYTFHILDALVAEIDLLDNPYRLPIEELFTMAARINKKRAFLFVSNVLGKHVPISPNKGLLIGALLAARYCETVKGLPANNKNQLVTAFLQDTSVPIDPFIVAAVNPLIIGFAETATALGHAFFSCFQHADFFHTTREEVASCTPEVIFEEEHSHATSHRCYIPTEMIAHQREIILVDDEMTTGKTALNIIKSIHCKYPRSEYTVVSILDWRSEDHHRQFADLEKELAIKINVVSLLSGKVRVKPLKEMKENVPVKAEAEKQLSIETADLSEMFSPTSFSSITETIPYIKETGRFGLNSRENDQLHQRACQAAAFLSQKRKGKRTLCLGTGEFMYLPMKIAAEMGKGVFYQSTTRSPIYVDHNKGYGVRYGLAFPNPEDMAVQHFVYNIAPGCYDEIFLFFERAVNLANLAPLLEELKKTKINSVQLIFFSKKQR
ncbi:phosphoribosyltransferase family protein [Neobacillus sp. OS1-32]|uniref:Phosphoribosyltransferase family protein n=1 Tax=Neobacillus paridis TaxID=2803862 RepID=A0ABS1TTF8_9BACI|nr:MULTISPECIES: phosphoribosyltransferase family protein [Neobacillus]MBL4953833.1 phosphoribosyltransferase family protein [Neobacillus paridis]WML30949.1 phosphoribosyltransferase family protein [Neobacillus sp. OS1-32]